MKSSVLKRAVLAVLILTCPFEAAARAQQVGHAPIEVHVPQAPAPAVALGRIHLVYELHLTNLGGSPVTIDQLEVVNGQGAALAGWRGLQLWQRLRTLGQTDTESAATGILQPGRRTIAYLWVTLAPAAASPTALVHRLTVARATGERDTIATTALSPAAAPSPIASPVRGGAWVAVRGPSNGSGHRLSLVTLQGRARVPQRFAVDWMRLGDDGLAFHGDPTDVSNWYGYDMPVYASAGGLVAFTRDGAPDRPAFAAPPPAVIDAADASGNVLVIDMGSGRFATYAHLRPGSLRVTKGDRVVEGQLLARVGNSGNTLGPHLHFHIGDAAEPLAGEGLPFTLLSFELIGRIASLPSLLAGSAWTATAAQPSRTVTAEVPLENMVLRFKE